MSKFLPSLFYLKAKDKFLGAHLTQGVVFKDLRSPIRWLIEHGLPEDSFTVEKVDLVYFPSNIPSATKGHE